MTIYFIETGESSPSIAEYSATENKSKVRFPWASGTEEDVIVDYGSGWLLRDSAGKEKVLTYCEVTNVVNAFIIMQREGHRIYQARIYRGSRVANIRSRRR
jgi:hypothetical protein